MVTITVTVGVVLLPFVDLAYRAPALHVALETCEAVIALLAGYVLYGRFRSDRRLQQLLLVLALYTWATANLVLTALPNAVALAEGANFNGWTGLVIRSVGTLLFVGAALVPPGRQVGVVGARRWSAGVGLALLALTGVGIAVADRLPPTLDPSAPVPDPARPVLEAHPAVLAVQVVSAICFLVAAAAFTHAGRRNRDELLRWLGAGCVLATAARVHYLLFPSLYSDYLYTGDILRLGFYVFLSAGAAREIRSYWELRTRAAILEDRRRTARDLHDGLSQELAFIVAQSRRLAGHPGDELLAERISEAASRAQFEARRALRALTRPQELPFPAALQQSVEDLGERYAVKVVTDLDPSVVVEQGADDVLLRIVGEAMRNAVRHGQAHRIDVRLTADPLCLSVVDDGRGFDPGRTGALRAGGFGLTSMRERAAGLGAELSIASHPGEGTTVRVVRR